MISVIVPVYKSKGTLERCVKSLTAQTERDLQIILVDDGSPDGSGEICDTLAAGDGRICVVHKKNGGVSSARNAGLDAASGEYLLFADSDDYAEPDLAQKLLEGIGEDDIAICGFHHHYQGRDIVRLPKVQGDSGEENFLALYGQGFLNMPWNKLYRRSLAGRFDEDLSLGEDLLFNLDYLRRADGIAIVKAPLCHYIQDETGESLSSQKRADRLALAKRIWEETSAFYRELSGHEDESGVINARLVQDALDDIEGLPFDEARTKEEKRKVIEDYCKDADLAKAGAHAALQALDYKVIHFCLRRRWTGLAYELCEARAALVRARRGNETQP